MKKNIIISMVFILVFAPFLKSQDMNIAGENILATAAPQEQGASSYFLSNSILSLDYNFSFPFGDLKDFTKTNSYTGFAVDLKGLVTDNLAVGGMIGYQSYYKKEPRQTYEFEDGALTSTIFRYFYTIPMRVTAAYFFNPSGFAQPFVGLGVGVNYNERMLEVGFYTLSDKSWNFVMAPEVGIIVPFGKYSEWGASLKVRYNYQIYDRDNFNGLQYLDLGIGCAYSF